MRTMFHYIWTMKQLVANVQQGTSYYGLLTVRNSEQGHQVKLLR